MTGTDRGDAVQADTDSRTDEAIDLSIPDTTPKREAAPGDNQHHGDVDPHRRHLGSDIVDDRKAGQEDERHTAKDVEDLPPMLFIYDLGFHHLSPPRSGPHRAVQAGPPSPASSEPAKASILPSAEACAPAAGARSTAHKASLTARTPPPLRVNAATRLELRFLVVSRILFPFSPSKRTRSICRHRASQPARPVEHAVESALTEDILGPFAKEAFLPVEMGELGPHEARVTSTALHGHSRTFPTWRAPQLTMTKLRYNSLGVSPVYRDEQPQPRPRGVAEFGRSSVDTW